MPTTKRPTKQIKDGLPKNNKKGKKNERHQ